MENNRRLVIPIDQIKAGSELTILFVSSEFKTPRVGYKCRICGNEWSDKLELLCPACGRGVIGFVTLDTPTAIEEPKVNVRQIIPEGFQHFPAGDPKIINAQLSQETPITSWIIHSDGHWEPLKGPIEIKDCRIYNGVSAKPAELSSFGNAGPRHTWRKGDHVLIDDHFIEVGGFISGESSGRTALRHIATTEGWTVYRPQETAEEGEEK